MNLPIKVTQEELSEVLLNIAPVRPIMIWGAPGIGKSSLVEQFAENVGLECVSLLGSQLAPEDVIGVPQIRDGKSVFCPPTIIAREKPYILFLDELNACSQDVQKAFYSLILEHRIGEYYLPSGSIIVAAGNRAQDSAIVKIMSSALVNRLLHVELKPDVNQWLSWAYMQDLHPWVTEYIQQRPDHLFSPPPKTEEPFSTPRSWHLLSDSLKAWGDNISQEQIRMLAYGCVSANDAGMFSAFVKTAGNKNVLQQIIDGKEKWPFGVKERDTLYFLTLSFRSRLIHDLPENKKQLSKDMQYFVHRSKAMIKELASINMEYAQLVISGDGSCEERLPNWYLVEIIRDIPRLAS